MFRKLIVLTIVLLTLGRVGGIARAEITGNSAAGKVLFHRAGAKGKSCNDCHPRGGSNNQVVRGKRVPNLTQRIGQISENRLVSKAMKHLQEDVALTLTASEFNNLLAFLSSLPKSGY